MRTVSISVTEASRNFADCVNRVRYQGATFLLHKNGVPVAKIMPVGRNAKNESVLQPVGEHEISGQRRGEISEIW